MKGRGGGGRPRHVEESEGSDHALLELQVLGIGVEIGEERGIRDVSMAINEAMSKRGGGRGERGGVDVDSGVTITHLED